MQNILMLGVLLVLLQLLDLLHGKLPPRELKTHYPLGVNLVVVGLESTSHFQLLY